MPEYKTPTEVYVLSGILFLLPCSLVYFAWRSLFRAEKAPTLANWRMITTRAAIGVAIISTLLNVLWNASWLYCGGSPHGMGAAPGPWQHLGWPLLLSFATAVALSFFGKGKGRILLLAWSASMYFVFQMIYMLQFD